MAITFPSPVADGYSFTAENGVVYTYDSSGGGGWYAYHPDGLNDVYVNIDGDTMTGDLTVPSLNGGPLAGLRNQLINGDFRIWQRATTYTPPDNAASVGYKTADRWAINGSNKNSGEMLRLPQSSTQIRHCPKEFPYAFAWYTDSAAGGVDERGPLIQCVELPEKGAGPFQPGTQWTFSCYASVDITGYAPSLSFSDSYTSTVAVNITTATPNWEEIEAPTADRWGRYAVTYTIDNVAPTDGTHTCIRANLGSIGRIQTRVAVTGIQLEPGPVATPFEHRPIGLETSLCQRYFQQLPEQFKSLKAGADSGVFADGQIPLVVPMRTTPTCTFVRDPQGSTLGSLPEIYPHYTNRFTLMVKYSGAGSAGDTLGFKGTADAEL